MSYNKQQLEDAIKISYSLTETLRNLNLIASGSSIKKLKLLIEEYNIDISHFKKKDSYEKHRTLQEIFKSIKPYQSHRLRQRLIFEGYKEYKCESCNLSEWLNEPIKECDCLIILV